MRIASRRLHREIIERQAGESMLARELVSARFPFRWHYHPEFELTVIERGEGLRFVGDSIQEFRAGDCCLLGPDCPHSWRSSDDGEHGVRALVVQFSAELLSAALPLLPELRGVGRLLARAHPGLAVTGGSALRTAELVRALVAAPPGSPARLLSLLAALAEINAGGEASALSAVVRPVDAAAQARLGGLFTLLQAAPGGISQAAAARHLGVTPEAFSRFFHRAVGRTFAAYRNDLRIGGACQQLLGSDRPISLIAQDAGFANLSNFNRRFKAAKGMTPRAFRRLGSA
jgi:AraC-like DNA-binding protein